MDLAAHLGTVDLASMFDAFERSATSVGLAVFVVHVDAKPPVVIHASKQLSELVGRPLDAIIGHPPWELVARAQQDSVREIIARRGPGAEPFSAPFEVERPDGSRTVEVGVARVNTGGAELAVCYFRDTTALSRSEARSRSLIDTAPDGVVIIQQGKIVQANPVALRMFGGTAEDIRGRYLAEFLLPEEAARAAERIKSIFGGTSVPPSEYELANGVVGEVHSVVYEYNDQPAILAFVRDVTERRRMQLQLVRADRLAALGTMAATVAHEINNPLTYLQLNLQRLGREAGREPDPTRAKLLRDHIDTALHGVERIARIVRDLRTHSRDNLDEPDAAVDVVAAVDAALRMVDHELRHRAQLVRHDPAEPAIILGSAAQLEQVVLNLLVNAIQALDDRRSNEITLDITVGDTIGIRVGDTGPGIPAPERAFEPFFTTKPIGQGTGLGLAVCKQLVERMGGTIAIASTGPQGTVIAITLPRRATAAPAPARKPEPTPGERLRVLVIDDEIHVRKALGNVLKWEHDVELAEDGESALAKLATTEYDVILCDLMMPKLSGKDVYERIRSLTPGRERRIVFVTGGAFVPALAAFLETIDNLVLAKPFGLEEALAVVRKARARL